MKRLPSLILSGVLAVPLTAVSQQASPQSLEQRVQVLERRVRALSELVLRMDRLQQEVQQLRGEMEVQSHALEAVKKRQRDLYQDVDQRLSRIPPAGSATTMIPPAPPPKPRSPVATSAGDGAGGESPPGAVVQQSTKAGPAETRAYNHAFELLTQQRRYNAARKAFQSFLAKYPAGQYADNAQYWLGEASYVTRDFSVAMGDFSAVLTRFPDSPKVPSAMLKIGYIEFEQQQHAKSRQTLEKLIRRYPTSSEARLAKDFIRNKGL